MTAILCHGFSPESRIATQGLISPIGTRGIRSQDPKNNVINGRPMYMLTRTVVKVVAISARAIFMRDLWKTGINVPEIDQTMN